MALLKFEGQQIEIPDQMAQNDKALLEFVATFSPEMANATIARQQENGQTVISLVKRAGPKGRFRLPLPILDNQPTPNTLLPNLIAASDQLNPALLLAWQLKREEAQGSLSLERLLALQPDLELAIQQGEEQAVAVQEALKNLLTVKSGC